MLLTACSPELNWRDARAAAGQLTALFPCRPDEQTRVVELAGAPLKMSLQSCEAQGLLFALAAVEVSELGAVRPVKDALAEGVATKLRRVRRDASSFQDKPTRSRAESLERWTLSGVSTDGRLRHVELGQFNRGLWVFQATVLGGAPIPAEDTQPFFDGFRWAP